MLDLLRALLDLMQGLMGGGVPARKPAPEALVAKVREDGGTIGRARAAGLGVASSAPFPPLTGPREFYVVEARYTSDHGLWLVCAPDQGAPCWIWHSATGRTTAPGRVIAPIRVMPTMPAVSRRFRAFVIALVLVPLFVVLVVVLKWTRVI